MGEGCDVSFRREISSGWREERPLAVARSAERRCADHRQLRARDSAYARRVSAGQVDRSNGPVRSASELRRAMSGALFPKPLMRELLMRELQKEGCGGAGICIVLA